MSQHTASPDLEKSVIELMPALRTFAKTFCKKPEDADDLVQETLVKGIARISLFTPGTNLKAWLFTIMRNTFSTRYRKAIREAPGANACASNRGSTEPSQEWSLLALEVEDAVARLPLSHRDVLVIAGFGATYEEASQQFDCNLGTIKSRLSRARVALLSQLGESSVRDLVAADHTISRHQVGDHSAF